MARLLKGLPKEFQSMVKSDYGFLRFDADEVQDESVSYTHLTLPTILLV